jgi:hypothetical protein
LLEDVGKELAKSYNSNIVNVVSMGNNNGGSITYPARFISTIAVGASTKSNARALYSNTGTHIDFLAPGGAGSEYGNDQNIISTATSTAYKYDSGTSFSSPLAAGAASLLLAKRNNLYNDDIKRLLEISCDKMEEMLGADWTEHHGYGKINLQKAFKLLAPPHELSNNLTATSGYVHAVSGVYPISIYVDGLVDQSLYYVRRHEIRKTVSFQYYYNHSVWGRGAASLGWANDERLFDVKWCEVVPGALTSTSATLRTYVYEVWDRLSRWVGWYPTTPSNVVFGYSILGVPLSGPPLMPENFSISGSTSGHPLLTWSANTDPDFSHYVIEKRITSDGFAYLATTQGTSYEDLTERYLTGPPRANERVVYYRVKAVDNTAQTSIPTDSLASRVYGPPLEKALSQNKILSYNLHQNYPNPFNPSTVISYQLSAVSYVTLKVYDILGREITTLVNESKPAGEYEFEFNAIKYNLPTGVYFYRLSSGAFTSTRKFVLTK